MSTPGDVASWMMNWTGAAGREMQLSSRSHRGATSTFQPAGEFVRRSRVD